MWARKETLSRVPTTLSCDYRIPSFSVCMLFTLLEERKSYPSCGHYGDRDAASRSESTTSFAQETLELLGVLRLRSVSRAGGGCGRVCRSTTTAAVALLSCYECTHGRPLSGAVMPSGDIARRWSYHAAAHQAAKQSSGESIPERPHAKHGYQGRSRNLHFGTPSNGKRESPCSFCNTFDRLTTIGMVPKSPQKS